MNRPLARLLPAVLSALLSAGLLSCGGREHAELAPAAPLSLLVLEPAEGAVVAVASTPVRGRVLGGPAILGFNGQPLALAADGGFATSLALAEGENRLSFEVWPVAAAGRGSELLPNTPPALRLVRVVSFQRPALTVQFTAPADAEVLKLSPAQVSGQVSEAAAEVTVNGLPALVDPSGGFRVAVPLQPGPNTLQALARGAGNRSATASRQVVFAPPTAPQVQILEPAEGAISNLVQLPVRGTLSDPTAALKVQGQTVPVNADGSWSTTLAPPEGPLTLSAEALSLDGLTGSALRHALIDRTPPRISLDAAPPSPTPLPQLALAGTVIDASACQLWVQEAATGLAGPPSAARFATSVALAEGPNSLNFRAVDAAGNVGSLVLSVVRDSQGPAIVLDPLPPEGTCTLQVSGHAGVAGEAVTFTRDGEPLASTGNSFSFLWALRAGLNSTTLGATDALGNRSVLVLTRTCTPPPPTLSLSVTAPADGASFSQPSAPLAGRVSPATARVTVNGAVLPVQADGSFSGSAALTAGANILVFVASLDGSPSVTVQRTVSYSPGGGGAPPTIVFDDPRDGSATSARSITVLGHVDDPSAALTLQGKSVPLDAQGRFQLTVNGEREGVLGIRAEAVNPHGSSRNAMYVSFQWSPLQMAWAEPTPAEGAKLTIPKLTAAVALSRPALVDFNGQPGALEPNESGGLPFRSQAELELEEGVVRLVASAVDGAGNRASLARTVSLGLTAPVIAFTAPAFDPSGTFRTLQTGVTVTGTVTAPDVVKPLTLTLNGQNVALDGHGGFRWTFTGLGFGPNTLRAVATSAFGHSCRETRSVERVQDGGGDEAPRITVESPLEGFASGSASIPVSGRVNRAGLAVKVQNRVVAVDPLTLRFSAGVELAVGANTLLASATDEQGRSDSATVHGTRFEPGQIKVRWDLPAAGARLTRRTVLQRGQADQPGITRVTIDGLPMALSGSGASGVFQGSRVLAKGPQSLLLEALTVAGERLTERREVIVDPPLPRIVLDAPASARPGDEITLSVQAAPGTTLASAELSWNGGLLARLAPPFPAQQARVPADALAGTKLLVEALATDAEGETVTARTYVVVLGGGGGSGGPWVLAAFDDRSGLGLPGASAQVENGAPLPMGDAGLATLPALLPSAWVKVEKVGFAHVWRRGDQPGSKPQALFDARPTPLDAGVDVGASAYTGTFGKGAFQITVPSGALALNAGSQHAPLSSPSSPSSLLNMSSSSSPSLSNKKEQSESTGIQGIKGISEQNQSGLVDSSPGPQVPGKKSKSMDALPSASASSSAKLSLTALSTQGLPALLPKGWSAVSALWLQIDGATLNSPAALKLTALPGLPEAGLVWARWDEGARAWTAVAINVDPSQLAALPLPNAGGYALLAADPGATAPPPAVAGQALRGTEAGPWRTGLAATGAVDPALLPTVEAIGGVRATAMLNLGFGGHDPVASGTGLLAELVETYTLLNQALIEPEKRAQDGVGTRFVLGVDKEGAPTLRAATDGLSLELPVRMGRTFSANELVEGLIQVGFYHEDQVIAVGGELIGTSGGSTTRDGVTATFEAGAFASSTLVRVQGDPPSAWDSLWPELRDQGRVASSFSVDVAGVLAKGMLLSVADLGTVPTGIVPLLVQRRIVADQRVRVAVGALSLEGGAWKLSLPAESNPVLEGGSFAVLVPSKPWGWVTGTVSMPQGLAQAIRQALGTKGDAQKNLFLSPLSPKSPSSLLNSQPQEFKGMEGIQGMKGITDKTAFLVNDLPTGDVAVKDALVSANFIPAASGATGVFALPAFAPTSGKLKVTGQRWDLGLTGSIEVEVPSAANALRLTTIPFALQAVLPSENAVVDLSAVFSVLTTTPMDPGSLAGIKLYQGTSPASPKSPSSLLNSSAHEFKGMDGIKGMKGIKTQNTLLNPSSVEMNIRKQLSIDGRTLVITPETALLQGATYVLVVEGLKSIAGETAPKIERHVAIAAAPPPPAEADFTRITLGYPNASFDVPMTIPAGAIPAGASILIEGLGMGYSHSGTMPNGELNLTIRASLGERIRITVQIAGRTAVGHVSRYAAGDGRVTIGMDGGRIEANDGSRAAVIWPLGALDTPMEFTLSHSTARPEGIHSDYASETITGVLNLSFTGTLSPRVQPIWEFPAPTGAPNTSPRPEGLGQYGIYVKESSFEADGSPCEVWSLRDSARLANGKLLSFGGLPEVDWEGWGFAVPGVNALAANPLLSAAALPFQPPLARPFMDGMFTRMLSAMSVDSVLDFLSGQVDRKFMSSGEQKPLPGAAVFAANTMSGPDTLKRAGRLIQITGARGRYYLMSSLQPLVSGSAKLMAIDPDYGVTARATSSSRSCAHGHCLYMASTMVTEIQPSDLGDRIAPWAELRFEGHDVIAGEEARYLGAGQDGEVFAVVNGYDTRDHERLNVEVRVDGVRVEPADVTWSRAGAAGKWTARLRNLGPGIHTVEARVEDQARNLTRVERTLRVLDLGVEPAVDPAMAPSFKLDLEGGLESAKAEGMVKVKFSEPVSGISAETLVLEKQVGGTWEAVAARQLGSSGAVVSGERLHTVFIVPNVRMEAGRTYRVRGTAAIDDFDTPPKQLTQAPVEFKVANFTEVGTFTLPESGIRRIATLGGRTFVAVAKRIYLIRAGGAVTAPAVPFGATAEKDFVGQTITEMRVFRQVAVRGLPMDLLAVTTEPSPMALDHQAGLWVFNACNANPLPTLMFGVSLGPGASGYSPTLDCAGGFITVGRLASSVAVVSVAAGVQGWNGGMVYLVKSPGGANQQAIQQPFYLVNPEGIEVPTHPGVAMLPTGAGGTGDLAIAVGFPGSGIRNGKPMRGMPTAILPVNPTTGALVPQPPYVPLSGSSTPGDSEPDQRAFPGPFPAPLGGSGIRIAVIPNLSARLPDNSQVPINLALGQTSRPSGHGGPSLAILNEQNPAAPVFLGTWPIAALGTDASGAARPYDLPRVTPSVDAVTKLVAMPVKFTDTGKHVWFVIDFSQLSPDGSQPPNPRIVARVPADGQYGSFHNGRLVVQAAGGVKILKIADGVANVDEGECVIQRTTVLSLGDSGEGANPAFSGLCINDIKIKKENDLNLIDLKLCPWLLIAVDDGTPPTGNPPPPSFALPSTFDAIKKFKIIKIKLNPTQLNGIYKIFILAADSSGNPIDFLNHRLEDYWNGKPAETQLESDGRQ